MQNDAISRSKLYKSLLREETIVLDGLQYIRADAVKEKLSMAPSIEVAKVVVHARWKYNPPTATLVGSYNCTACGFCAFDHRVNECKYCPHCGARMGAKEE